MSQTASYTLHRDRRMWVPHTWEVWTVWRNGEQIGAFATDEAAARWKATRFRNHAPVASGLFETREEAKAFAAGTTDQPEPAK